MLERQSKFSSKLQQLHFAKLLLPETLTTEGGIEMNRVRISTLQRLQKESLDATASDFAQTRLRAKNLVSGQPYEALLSQRFALVTRKRKQFIKRLQSAQAKLISSLTRMNDFMAERLGQVHFRDGTLLFPNNADADKYNCYVTVIQHRFQLVHDVRKQFQQQLQKLRVKK